MKSTTHVRSSPLSLAALAFLLLGNLFGHSTQAALTIEDTPLFINSAGVPPNLILTLDDSGSMARAYTPDLCGPSMLGCNSSSESEASDSYHLATRSAKSAYKNPMYYNPDLIYRRPVDASGNSLAYGPDPTNYPMRAYTNGYHPTSGTINLDTSYRPTAWYWRGAGQPAEVDAGPRLMNHYTDDARCSSSRCQYLNASGSWTNSPNTITCGSNAYCQTNEVLPAYYYKLNTARSGCAIGNTPGSTGYEACFDIVVVSSTSGPGTKDVNGDGVINASDKDERANFAIWYSFYRTRNLATISASSLAFNNLDKKKTNGVYVAKDISRIPRVAWQAINSCRSGIVADSATAPATSDFVVANCRGWDTAVATVSNAIKPFSSATGGNRNAFYQWLQRLPSAGGTPLRSAAIRAGRYFSTSGDNSPYDNDLTVAGQGTHLWPEYTCRKNYQIIMTDGRWNLGNSTEVENIGVGNLDGGLVRPYKDDASNSNNLADIANKYWNTDLRTSLTNNVSPSIEVEYEDNPTAQSNDAQNNPQTKQHMVNFTVGFGLTGFLASSNLVYDPTADEPTFAGSYNNTPSGSGSLLAGTRTWPVTNSTSNSGQGADGNVADLWHAALNSRGKFYSADSPDKLLAAFEDILDVIGRQERQGGGASLAGSAAAFPKKPDGTSDDIISYQAINNPDWSGLFKALQLKPDGTLGTSTYWQAETLIPAFDLTKVSTNSDRKIFTHDGSSSRALISCDSALESAFGTATCTDKLYWLRGDHSKEVINGGTLRKRVWVRTAKTLRDNDVMYPDAYKTTQCRNTADNSLYTDAAADSTTFNCPWVLGDIINSNPVYVHDENLSYATGTLPSDAQSSYKAYLTTKLARKPMVYVGANDGMLHAFQANKGETDSGKELFAYVPRGVYANLNLLTDPDYAHKFYVNGPAGVGDAYIGSSWKTYLVGGLGAGGKSVYALDISNPTSFYASDVKWEYNATGSDTDLGLLFSRPQIVPLNNGEWGAIFGNGYNSGSTPTNDKAFLYILNLSTGSLIAKIAAGTATANGLAMPYLHDSNGDKVIDYAYAGDLQGNLWKFDLTGNNPSNWDIAKDASNNKVALFTARNASSQVQAITSQPKVATHPSGGLMVYFGTGKYLEVDDIINAQLQTFYGIWDKPAVTGTATRSDLQPQTITFDNVAQNNDYWRRVSNNSVAATKRGWYLDFPAYERIINTPIVLDTKPDKYDRVLFTTVIPEKDPCKSGGTSWLMQLNLLTGGKPTIEVLDVNADGSFTASDQISSDTAVGKRLHVGIASEMMSVDNPRTGERFIVIGGSDAGSTDLDKNDDGVIDAHEAKADKNGDGLIDPEVIKTPISKAGPPELIYWQQIL